MKRHVEEKELPYFAATLTAYLRESHPELLPDKHFIAERSDHAAQTYERAVRNGNSVYEPTFIQDTEEQVKALQAEYGFEYTIEEK